MPALRQANGREANHHGRIQPVGFVDVKILIRVIRVNDGTMDKSFAIRGISKSFFYTGIDRTQSYSKTLFLKCTQLLISVCGRQ